MMPTWFQTWGRLFPLPAWCLQCGLYVPQRGKLVCDPCHQALPRWQQNFCPACGGLHKAGDCRETWLPEVSDFQALFEYQDPLHQWLSSFKYGGNLIAGRFLRQELARWLEEHPSFHAGFDGILPVPQHFWRLRERGFNQTLFLLQGQTQIPVLTKILVKARHTKHQAGLKREERLGNLVRSFALGQGVEDKRLILFDDVCTTGSTFDQLSRLLLKAGAEEVKALALCRTRPQELKPKKKLAWQVEAE